MPMLLAGYLPSYDVDEAPPASEPRLSLAPTPRPQPAGPPPARTVVLIRTTELQKPSPPTLRQGPARATPQARPPSSDVPLRCRLHDSRVEHLKSGLCWVDGCWAGKGYCGFCRKHWLMVPRRLRIELCIDRKRSHKRFYGHLREAFTFIVDVGGTIR